jgi:hypothetical protein
MLWLLWLGTQTYPIFGVVGFAVCVCVGAMLRTTFVDRDVR